MFTLIISPRHISPPLISLLFRFSPAFFITLYFHYAFIDIFRHAMPAAIVFIGCRCCHAAAFADADSDMPCAFVAVTCFD